MDTEVYDNDELSRFELEEQGYTAYADYTQEGATLRLDYVFSPEPLRGQGTAGRLMQGIVEAARERNLRLRPICGYAVAWLKKHPETADLVE